MTIAPNTLIWIVDGDPDAQSDYKQVLEPKYPLRIVPTLRLFRQYLRSTSEPKPNLIVADLMLRKSSFLDAIDHPEFFPRRLTIPFLVVSSIDDEETVRDCFMKGALDYLTKPYAKSELLVKLDRFFRDAEKPQIPSDVVIDLPTLTVSRGTEISSPLTAKELQLFALLNTVLGGLISRKEIITTVWGTIKVDPKTLDVHLSNLRRKIAKLDLDLCFFEGYYRLLKK